MKCYQRLVNILYKDRVSNEEVCRKIQAAIGEYDPSQNMKTEVVSPHLNVFWFSKGNPKGNSVRTKNKRKTEEDVERQY